MLEWFTSYLSNRKQYVAISKYESVFDTVNCGDLKDQYWDLYYF